MFFLYNLALTIVLPFYLFLVWRHTKNHPHFKLKDAFKSRLGINKNLKKHSIWVHAVSMGETQAAFVLIEKLAKKHPNTPITLSHGSLNGAEHAQRLSHRVKTLQTCMMPLDYPFIISHFLNKNKPLALIIIETEIWPNLFHLCKKNNVKLFLTSTRVTKKSFSKYKKYSFGLIKNTLKKATHIGVQSKKDKKKMIKIGVSRESISITGNLKFDKNNNNTKQKWLDFTKSYDFVWVAASVHPTEDEKVIQAHIEIKNKIKNSLLILAPRQPREFTQTIDVCKKLCKENKITMSTRTQNDPTKNPDVFVLDTTGELLLTMPRSHAVFVGGSFIPLGGHNILEPAMFGVPIISGPSYYDQIALYKPAMKEGAVYIAEDSYDLSKRLLFLSVAENQKKERKKSATFFKKTSGGSDEFLKVFEKHML